MFGQKKAILDRTNKNVADMDQKQPVIVFLLRIK